jgi:hypothetical protein
MTAAEWWALIIQAIATVFAGVAAGFAWRTARNVRRQSESEARHRSSEHLKVIHRLITDLAHTVNTSPADYFIPSMRLRTELLVSSVPLPSCIEVVDEALGELSVSQFNRLAPAALKEVEAAQKVVWKDQIVSTLPKAGPQ